jgi:AbrB family looped-hinge helix DNA binding protein
MQRFYAKLSSKNQITLPARAREVLGLGPGDHIRFEIDENKRVTLWADPRFAVRELRGIVPAIDRPMSDDFDAEIDEAMQDMVDLEPGATPAR